MFAQHHRAWAALVLPALVLALVFTFTRSAWVGACVGIGMLFLLRDFRLMALLPVALAAFLALAPTEPDDAALLDLQPEGSVERRSRRDDEVRARASSRTIRSPASGPTW